MKLDTKLFDSLTEKAKESPRLRMNYDLRTSGEDSSQRMLNALEPGTEVPIHRHTKTTETVIVVRGKVRQNYYELVPDPEVPGKTRLATVESFIAGPGCEISGFSVPVGQWHNSEALEPGTIIFEAKDGAYEPTKPEDVITNE